MLDRLAEIRALAQQRLVRLEAELVRTVASHVPHQPLVAHRQPKLCRRLLEALAHNPALARRMGGLHHEHAVKVGPPAECWSEPLLNKTTQRRQERVLTAPS